MRRLSRLSSSPQPIWRETLVSRCKMGDGAKGSGMRCPSPGKTTARNLQWLKVNPSPLLELRMQSKVKKSGTHEQGPRGQLLIRWMRTTCFGSSFPASPASFESAWSSFSSSLQLRMKGNENGRVAEFASRRAWNTSSSGRHNDPYTSEDADTVEDHGCVSRPFSSRA